MELRGFYRVPRWVDAQKILFFLFVPFGHKLWNWILVLSQHYCDRCCDLYEVHLFFIIFFGHLFWVLVLKGLVGLHRIVQLQLTQHYWLGHRLGLPWYWIVCLGNEQRSFYCFWDCIQVLHFRLFCWPWWWLHFFKGIPAHSSIYDGQRVTAAVKLKDAYSLEGKLWPT